MSSYPASIRQARRRSQEDLVRHREHCSADPDRLAAIGLAAGQQVRVRRTATAFGLYTVSEVRDESPDNVVRMGAGGRLRLGTSGEFPGVVDSQVPHPTFSQAQARANNEFIERLTDNGSQATLIAIAPHGGDIEPNTDRQAERVASRLGTAMASAWRCKGWKDDGDPFDTWHITSTDICALSFPRLATVISRGFTAAVSFHGFKRDEILIGGLAPPALKQDIQTAIADATAGSQIPVRIAEPGDQFGGAEPGNLVNRITADNANGIQIEQSIQARSHHWFAIADAVANVYRDTLRRQPAQPTNTPSSY
jgi:phage replication-related protein YjqB (UPF0714/DUF867 family)